MIDAEAIVEATLAGLRAPADHPAARLAELVLTRLDGDQATTRLREEAANGAVSARTRTRVVLALEEELEQDPAFAEHVRTAASVRQSVAGPVRGPVIQVGGGVHGGITINAGGTDLPEQFPPLAVSDRPSAAERQLAATYRDAIGQLNSDEPEDRLAGIERLERIGQDHPEHRGEIVDVLCTYLRLRYRPPGPAAPEAPGVAERDVRIAAQQVLGGHLDPARDAAFWGEFDLDLRDAVLLDVDLSGCRVRRADLGGARFVGAATFARAVFTGTTRFGGACFTATAEFTDAVFAGKSFFSKVRFAGDAVFTGVRFGPPDTEDCFAVESFDQAEFGGRADFREAVFAAESTGFSRTVFDGPAQFDGARFRGRANFTEGRFGGDARFPEVVFAEIEVDPRRSEIVSADFTDAAFAAELSFDRVTFPSGLHFGQVAVAGKASFRHTTFLGPTRFDHTAFGASVDLTAVDFSFADVYLSGMTIAGGVTLAKARLSSHELSVLAGFLPPQEPRHTEEPAQAPRPRARWLRRGRRDLA